MIRTTLSLLAAALIGTGAANAGNLADISIIDRASGQTLPVYRHHGRHYIEGKAGNRYAVQLNNRTGGRILTVLSVDGVNAVSGQTAAANQTGYVLSPGSSAEIAGWRKDMSDVAAFYFTALGNSYAARTGRPNDVGVIGVAVFTEQIDPPVLMEAPVSPQVRRDAGRAERSAANDSLAASGAASSNAPAEAMSRSKSQAEEKIGTGHGERIHAPTQNTEFRRASRSPAEVITIYYDSRSNLIARGIIPRYSRTPNAFPGGFVPDPS